MKANPRPARWALLAGAALALRAFGADLRLGLTDSDALADAAWAAHPISEQLLQPLTGGLAGLNANFWRPVPVLAFAVQERLFGWAPAGWQATSLVLHVVASVLAGWSVDRLARLFGSDDRRLGPLAGVLFAVQPLAIEIVPATARQIELWLAIGVFGFLGALVSKSRGWTLAAFVVALGAKESALVLLPVGALVVWLSTRARLREMAIAIGPLVAISAVYLMLRTQVLHGIGGYGVEGSRGVALWRALLTGGVELLAPSLCHAIKPVPIALVALGALAAWIWITRVVERRLLLVLGALALSMVVLGGLTDTLSRRVLYVPSLLAMVALASALSRRRFALVVLLGVPFLHGTPVIASDPSWSAVSTADAIWMKPELYATLPVNSRIGLVDKPYEADLDPRRELLLSRETLTHAALAYSVQAWFDANFPERRFHVELLSEIALDRPLAEDAPQIQRLPDGVRVLRSATRRADPSDAEVRARPDSVEVHASGMRLLVWTARGMIDATP